MLQTLNYHKGKSDIMFSTHMMDENLWLSKAFINCMIAPDVAHLHWTSICV